MSAPRNRRVPWKAPPAPVVRRNIRVRIERLSEEEPVRWWHWLIAVTVALVLSIGNWN